MLPTICCSEQCKAIFPGNGKYPLITLYAQWLFNQCCSLACCDKVKKVTTSLRFDWRFWAKWMQSKAVINCCLACFRSFWNWYHNTTIYGTLWRKINRCRKLLARATLQPNSIHDPALFCHFPSWVCLYFSLLYSFCFSFSPPLTKQPSNLTAYSLFIHFDFDFR